MIRFATFVFLFVASSGFLAQSSATRTVEISAPDGVMLKATYYDGAKRGPAVLLLHMCNSDRTAWEPVGRQLRAAGISALALDYRGFGESGGDRLEDPQKQQDVRDKVWPGDIDAAFKYLSEQSNVDRNRIGAAGGSCGVNQAVQVARRHGEVKSLVLLAGDTNTAGMNFLQQTKWLPVFTAAADDDEFIPQAPQSMEWLAELSGNPRNRSLRFREGKHGTEIFGRHPELTGEIVSWFVKTLVRSPAEANRPLTVKKTTASDFWSALNETPVDRAVRMFHNMRQRDPQAYVLSENTFRDLGYERLQTRQVKDAIQLFKLWTEAYPKSADAYDSLGDGYLADSQEKPALQAAQRALELLAADPVPEPFKTMIRTNIKQKLDKLAGLKK